VLAVCVALGMLAHVAGDMGTHDGCPLLYPLSRHEFGLLPEPFRITTNKLAEHWIVSPLLLVGLAYFLWRDAGPTLGNHLVGRLPPSGGCYPGRAGGPWLCRIFVLSLFHAVVVPSGFSTTVQPC
jgi:membrane-bound metal-dependent hydrolase YbcI (DUF457 family)